MLHFSGILRHTSPDTVAWNRVLSEASIQQMKRLDRECGDSITAEANLVPHDILTQKLNLLGMLDIMLDKHISLTKDNMVEMVCILYMSITCVPNSVLFRLKNVNSF